MCSVLHLIMFLNNVGFHLQGKGIDMLSKLNSEKTKFQTENMQKTGGNISPGKSRHKWQVYTYKIYTHHQEMQIRPHRGYLTPLRMAKLTQGQPIAGRTIATGSFIDKAGGNIKLCS